ncbi:DUF3275 family protein [Methylotuvimicrobium sp. KM1]|uniref:DUF3275 family protein n=1 Tax=Methylotuvimicrobium sp. KM1 TaxID=3377707 RepID=UPI00384BF255
MISLPAILTIKIINGRNGEFRVGSLHTEIGDFAVKDPVLDQYDEGCYEGVFGISRVFSSSYTTTSRIVIETRAVLESIALANVNQLSAEDSEPIEQDPIDEDKPRQENHLTEPAQTPESSLPEGQDVELDQGDEADADPDAKLFGLLWPLQDSVKLDPTVDRGQFRRQRDRLKELGYQFKPVGQVWLQG